MKRFFILFSVACLLLACNACPRADSKNLSSNAALEVILDRLRRTNASAWGVTVPGMGAALLTDGQAEPTEATSGSADPPGDEPLRLVDRFHIGSLTKTFTAALIMLLDQEGRLGLDQPISVWLDYPEGDDVTIRMLLGHTSGLPDFSELPGLTRRETPREAIALAAAAPPLFAPGTRWAYSNTNYIILGVIAEQATGEPWENLIRTRFLEPLGLDSTYVWEGSPRPDTATGSRMACGYADEPRCAPQSGLDLLAVKDGPDWTLAWAAGAMVSTPRDVCRWISALVSGKVLDAEHRDLMITPTPESIAALRELPAFGPTRWVGDGLGLFKYDIEGAGSGWGHEGSIDGFVANAAYLPDARMSVAILSNFAMADSFSALGDLVLKPRH